MSVDDLAFPLPADGERFLPSFRGSIRYEHLHRYALCRDYVQGRDVLDIASGEGYGSALLAAQAAHVFGVDVSEAAVNHAARTYDRENLRFLVGDACSVPLETNSVDVVVSFETIEHVFDHRAMLDEVQRVLRPNGTLIISSPNKATYTDAAGHHNPFHLNELYIEDFSELLRKRFTNVALFGQRLTAVSMITRIDREPPTRVSALHGSPNYISAGLPPLLPLYAIAVCTNDVTEMSAESSIYLDDEQDLFTEGQALANRAFELLSSARRRVEFGRIESGKGTTAFREFAQPRTFFSSIDVVEDNRTGIRTAGPIVIAGAASFTLHGWAVVDGLPADRVIITIDGNVIASAAVSARPDVSKVYGDPTEFSGFRAAVEAGLKPGLHKLQTYAVSDSARTCGALRTIDLYVVDVLKLECSPTLCLDPFVPTATRSGPPTISLAEVIRLTGWAVDPLTKRAFTGVALLVNGAHVVPVGYEVDRKDVAAALGFAESIVGIKIDLLGDSLGVGAHVLRLIAVSGESAAAAYVSQAALHIVIA